jgi:hypothetical protein
MSNNTSRHRGETLTEKVGRLEKEYIACDDFPTARREVKEELALARAALLLEPAGQLSTSAAPPLDPISQLEADIAQLSYGYAECDDFPTARGDIKRDLDAARESLRELKDAISPADLTATLPGI